MPDQSTAYVTLIKGVAMRRLTLLRGRDGKMIAPPRGTDWFPKPREQSLCESYVALVAAEIESYLEAIAMRALDAHMNGQTASFMAQCGGSEEFCARVAAKQRKWANNHNTSWAKVGDTFEFIGLPQKVFPVGLWDEIDAITHERGGIVHEGVGLRQLADPREGLERIDRFIVALKTFDTAYEAWISAFEAEVARLRTTRLAFPPL
jgi:hypothetical protein